MSDALKAAEDSVAAMVGSSFSCSSPSTSSSSDPESVITFGEKFDAKFQTRIAALALRDDGFMRRAAHLLDPSYFENIGEAMLVSLSLNHFNKYRCAPDPTTLVALVKDAAVSGVIRKDVLPLVVAARKEINADTLANREYVEDKLVEFVRHQAVTAAVLKSVDLIEQKKFPQIEATIKKAVEIGINEDGDAYDYFGRIRDRTDERLEIAVGKRPPQGITTGVMKMDDLLYHRGWGRKELATIMGGAKAGKTAALINFAKSASLAGKNVLYVTLEVSARIIAERLDASISDTMVKELGKHIHDVNGKIADLEARAGKLLIHEFPSGTLSPNALRKLIERHRSRGIKFDLVVVDYADIMAPNFRTQDAIENSKSVYVDLRAIAFEFDVAMLTATQTNRVGYMATVAKAEHVAEDFNKVRTVDLMISINKTEEEAARGEARLYFAASRNQESGFTIFIKQDLSKMQFIQSVLRVE